MPSSEITKGHNFERKIASMLREIWPDAKRGFQSRFGSQEECDVEGTPFAIECKVGKRPPPPWKALAQAQEDKRKRTPVAILKRDREQPVVCMFLDDWINLCR